MATHNAPIRIAKTIRASYVLLFVSSHPAGYEWRWQKSRNEALVLNDVVQTEER